MPDIRIKQEQIDSLAKKLDEVSDVLSKEEQELLTAVFKLAGAMLSGSFGSKPAVETEGGSRPVAPVAGTVRSPALSAGFKEAFKPLKGAGANPAGIDIDVHVGW